MDPRNDLQVSRRLREDCHRRTNRGLPQHDVCGPRGVTLSGGKPDRKSVYYEVVLEDEDLSMHPSVQVFRKYPTDLIAGTLISPGDFVPTQT